MNAWLYGPPGTGKTTVARWAVSDVCASGAQRIGVHVNCWQHRTLYSVLQAIIDELRILMAEAQDTNCTFDRIQQAFRDRPSVIILDEIDRPMPSQREQIIYGLLNLPRTGLICIGNSTRAPAMLDERIRSRLSTVVIEFPAYSPHELEEVVTDRALQALALVSWTPSHIKRICEEADGDARVAIRVLRQAAAATEEKGLKKLDMRFVGDFFRQSLAVECQARLANLSDHERIIRELAAERGPLGTTQLRELYNQYCAGHDLQPIAPRTFSKYLSQLAAARILNISLRPMAKGGRIVRVEQV